MKILKIILKQKSETRLSSSSIGQQCCEYNITILQNGMYYYNELFVYRMLTETRIVYSADLVTTFFSRCGWELFKRNILKKLQIVF